MANARYTNLPSQNLSTDPVQTAENKTRTHFNGFYEPSIAVDGSVWDIVYAFFLKTTGHSESAQAMAEAVLESANSQGLNPLDLIRDLGQFSGLELDQAICMYLNDTRRGTSLLGVSVQRIPNKHISRNIIA